MTAPVPRFRIRTRMTARDTNEPHRTSSPLELLFDLTFVVAVAQVADELAKKIDAGLVLQGIVPFVMVFFAIWWAWLGFTWFASAYDSDDVIYRLLALVQMGGVLVLAAAVPAAFEHQDFLVMTLGYVIMRIAMVAQWLRAAIESSRGRPTAMRYAVGTTVVQLLWLARLLLPTDAGDQWWSVYLAFCVLVVFEAVVPYWAERAGRTTWHPQHIAERYGLFVIILLGETVAVLASGSSDVIAAGDRIGPLVAVAVSALVIIFALWWLYFLQPAGAGLAAHREGSFFWGYGHYFVFAGLGAFGGGLQVVLNSAGGHSTVQPAITTWVVAVPISIYLVALVVTHLRILPGIAVHVWIIAPTVLIVLLLPLLTDAIGVIFVFAGMAVVLAAAVAATLALGHRRFEAAK
jgi:low temperature requirement protein LtrA